MTYNPELAEQQRLFEVAGAAALTRLENSRLEAHLKVSVAELEASKVRLMEATNTERRRLERDLHDGVQQQLTAVRTELDRAAETFERDVKEGERMLVSIGEQMDGVLQGLRSLARGIYPVLLHDRGVVVALKSAARDAPLPVEVRGIGVGRYPEDVEAAVYFCCLDALREIAKDSGPDEEAVVHLWETGTSLHFQIRGSNPGFELGAPGRGPGEPSPLSDRIEAIGGTLTVASSAGHPPSVRGMVPSSRGTGECPPHTADTCTPPCASGGPSGC